MLQHIDNLFCKKTILNFCCSFCSVFAATFVTGHPNILKVKFPKAQCGYEKKKGNWITNIANSDSAEPFFWESTEGDYKGIR